MSIKKIIFIVILILLPGTLGSIEISNDRYKVLFFNCSTDNSKYEYDKCCLEYNKLANIAKLKSSKSWIKLLTAGKLGEVDYKHSCDMKILKYILHHATDHKHVSDRLDAELIINNTSNKK